MRTKNPFFDIGRISFTQNEKLSAHTTLGVGGKAKYYIEPETFYSLIQVVRTANVKKIPYKVIGNGSNLLVSDSGFSGLIINLRRLKGIKRVGDTIIAYAGETLKNLITYCEYNGLSGLEELSGIPGQIGGVTLQNAGAFGKSVADVVSYVKCYDGKIKTIKKENCGFGYRTSAFQNSGQIILSTAFTLKSVGTKEVADRIYKISERRKRLQPQGKTCGSVFRNPLGKSAGELIERVGLKGFSVGKAIISEKHANFIINNGNSAEDVYLLIEYVKQKVKQQLGVTLIEEVEKIGKFL
ncbi:MAG: UDP-N-acetylmuramate dehydrogenase [Clostridiales bacterium]|nr:UDP-N-acetylmuramate dehydrogenase [Clostridiales bacterium]